MPTEPNDIDQEEPYGAMLQRWRETQLANLLSEPESARRILVAVNPPNVPLTPTRKAMLVLADAYGRLAAQASERAWEREVMRDALLRYGQHTPECEAQRAQGHWCTCGFHTAIGRPVKEVPDGP